MADVILETLSDDELRAEVRRRGYEMHSRQFSDAGQRLIRELPELRRRLDELEAMAVALRTPGNAVA
jgi:plasmid replication initiation protein